MKILVTGAKGFIGQNLIVELRNRGYSNIYSYDVDTELSLLDSFCSDCDFVFNLAGVNRPDNPEDYMNGNFGFATTLMDTLKKHENKCPIMNSSSIQAALDNPYGKSKKAGEDALFAYGKENGSEVLVYRFPNVFGKWCRPNYNSAIATFCHNIAHDLPIKVNDRSVVMNLVYIDDVVDELVQAIEGQPHIDEKGYCYVKVIHTVTLGEIVDLLYTFKDSRKTLEVPYLKENSFEKKLYSTYLSYLPTDSFAYPLTMHADMRGSFTEIIRTPERGQISVNISKPGIEKGNHWHNTKNEKFVVVKGEGLIRFRKVNSDEIIEYHVSGEKIEVIDIPTGYTHSIINEGDTDLITFMWCNECFDINKPDTYYEQV